MTTREPRSLSEGLDQAVERANAAFLADPAAQEAARINGERWAAIDAANRTVGPYGVVMSVATATAIVTALRGQPVADANGILTPEVLARMVEGYLAEAAARLPK